MVLNKNGIEVDDGEQDTIKKSRSNYARIFGMCSQRANANVCLYVYVGLVFV